MSHVSTRPSNENIRSRGKVRIDKNQEHGDHAYDTEGMDKAQ
jgi:hypothetical protein